MSANIAVFSKTTYFKIQASYIYLVSAVSSVWQLCQKMLFEDLDLESLTEKSATKFCFPDKIPKILGKRKLSLFTLLQMDRENPANRTISDEFS